MKSKFLAGLVMYIQLNSISFYSDQQADSSTQERPHPPLLFPSSLAHDRMMSAQNLIKMARKQQRVAALKRKRTSLPTANEDASTAASVADKGHFVVYTADRKRFAFPITYLNSAIFREFSRMSEILHIKDNITSSCLSAVSDTIAENFVNDH